MKRGIMLRQGKIVTCLAFGSAFIFAGLSLSFPVSATPLADPSSSATATVHVSEACSLTSTVITPHTDNMGNGTYTDSLGSTKFTVKCNDASGFALYAIGYSGDEYGATSMLGDNELSIPTGTDASAGNTTSHWSMKISKDTTSYLPNSLTIENSFGSQHLIPSTYTKIASFPSSTDGINGTGSSILATYGVRISGTQAAGTYIGKVKYTLVHPNMVNNENKPAGPLDPTLCSAYSVCYAPNAVDIVGSMISAGSEPTLTSISGSNQAGKQVQTNIMINNYNSTSRAYITSNSAVELIAPNYSRPGYGFAGWSTDFEATSNSIIYGPNETITVGDVSTKGMILYPVWIASAGNLQGVDGQGWTGCSSLTTAPADGSRVTLASMTALTDTRDNNVYAVARLADGKCWMVENLRLNAEDTRSDVNKAKAQGYGDATNIAQGNLGKFIGLADSENANFSDTTTANSLYSIDGSNNTININDNSNYNPGYRIPRYNNNNTNRNLTASYNSCNSSYCQWYSYGNYYSWPAAIASTSYYDQNNSSATTSICPKGWRLPIGGQTTVNNTGDFYILVKTLMGGTEPNYNNKNGYGRYSGNVNGVWLGVKASNLLRSFPNNFLYSGSITNSSSTRGASAMYQSGSLENGSYRYNLSILFNMVCPGNNEQAKSGGYSIRCLVGS